MSMRRPHRARVASRRVLPAFVVWSVLAGSIGWAAARPSAAGSDVVSLVAQEPDLAGGLVVHLGCGDGELTARLRLSDSYAVHGLDTNPANVRKARAGLRQQNLYGTVSVDRLQPATTRLPYIDNMVTVLVASELGTIPLGEVDRVLAPGGVAFVRTSGGWQRVAKARPDGIDDWTHYLHGPDNNAVASDTVVGPPRRLQWQCGPKWTRHHDKMSSFSAMVSERGRIFYILDEGSTASVYLPSRWALICRDAFNGKLLWKRRIGTWYNRFKGLKDGPADAPRRLVARGGRVYVTLDLQGKVSCLDARTGATLSEYENTRGAEELLLADDVLFVLIGPGSLGDGRREARPVEERTIRAIDIKSGRPLWEHQDVVAALTMAVDSRQVYYFNFDSQRLICLDRRSGDRVWASAEKLPTPKAQRSFFGSKLVVADNVVLFASGEYSGMIKSTGGATQDDTLTALAADTGQTLWTAPHPPSGYSSPEDLFVIDGLVWCGATSNGRFDGTHVAYDLQTGAVKARFPADKTNYWFHHRCYSGRATKRYLLTSRTGLEFIDLAAQQWDLNHWVRGACLYGVMPANGLVYSPPAPCICYAETMLHSFNALAPAAATPIDPDPDAGRLEPGPAWQQPVHDAGQPADWPTYRGTNSRSGATPTPVPEDLEIAWSAPAGRRLSSVTVAGGNVFVADIDRHAVLALEADTGQRLWEFTAGGRVDSPPSYCEGRLLFGAADGYVYCLRATDGELIWRFQAAPSDRRVLVREQVESLWPVHGSVLVRDGVAHFVAGRSAFVDGGLLLYRLEARTGQLVSKSVLDNAGPGTDQDLQDTVKWLNMAVGRPDVLSCNERYLFMRSQAFTFDGQRVALGPEVTGPWEGTRQGGPTTHLFCPTGFLDDTWFHRTYWLYGQTWSSGWNGYPVAGQHAPAGKIMCVGPQHVYVFGRQPQFYRWTVPLEYRLFAATKHWQPAPPPDRRGQGQAAARAGKAAAKSGRKKTRMQPPRLETAPVFNAANYAWSSDVPILVRGMVLADRTLFVAGPPDVLDETKMGRRQVGDVTDEMRAQEDALAGKSGGLLRALAADSGRRLREIQLPAPPVFDGLVAAGGRLFVATTDGRVLALAHK